MADTGAGCEKTDEGKSRALAAAARAYELRAEDVLVLDMRPLVDYTDFFVIASAAGAAQIRGMAREVEKTLVGGGAALVNSHGRETGWMLLDFGDVVVHLFDRERREFYQLETLWGDAPQVEWRPSVPSRDPDLDAT